MIEISVHYEPGSNKADRIVFSGENVNYEIDSSGMLTVMNWSIPFGRPGDGDTVFAAGKWISVDRYVTTGED
jgi:hypothetical protein